MALLNIITFLICYIQTFGPCCIVCTSFYPFVLRISTEEPGRAEATQGWLHVIPLSSFGPYLHILWAVMKMCAVLFIKSLLLWTAAGFILGMGGGSTANPASVSETFPCGPLMPPSRCLVMLQMARLAALIDSICMCVWLDCIIIVVPQAAHHKRPI